MQAQNRVRPDHKHVENVQKEYPVRAVAHEPRGATGDITDDDQRGEQITLARGILRTDSLDDGERPAGAEADQHRGFEKMRHENNLYS